MYWQSTHSSSSQIDNILCKEDLTLQEILDHDNLLQELKTQNAKLIEFITREDIMAQLVSLVTEEPSKDLEECKRYHWPNIACEVLTSDIPTVNEKLSNDIFLSKLYNFLQLDPPLNPLLASFFSRTFSMLVSRTNDTNWYSYQYTCLQVLGFFKSQGNCLKLLLKHLGTSAIMDFMLKLLTKIEGINMNNNLIELIESENLIENIISLFDPSVDSDRHVNAAQLLCDTIQESRERPSTDCSNDPIVNIIQSPVMVDKLLSHMLNGPELSESSIVSGITVLMKMIEIPRPNPLDLHVLNTFGTDDLRLESEGISETTAAILSAILPYLPKFQELLVNPPKILQRDPLKLPCGTVEPLGIVRLSIVKLLAALIATNSVEVNSKLNELGTVQIFLDLFFKFTWNNFLHAQVEKCIAFTLNAAKPNEELQNPLITNLFVQCNILEKILEKWEENDGEQAKDNGRRRGYMGHLIKIANNINTRIEGPLSNFIQKSLKEDVLISWQHFIEFNLKPVIELHGKCLGGVHPSSDDFKQKDESFDFKNDMEEANSEQFTNSTFDDDSLNAQEDDETEYRAVIFKQMCTARLTRDLEDLDVWNHEDTVEAPNSPNEEERRDTLSGLKIDPDLWSNVESEGPVVNQENPWTQTETTQNTSDEGWADFGKFSETDQSFEGKFGDMNISSPGQESSSLMSNIAFPAFESEGNQEAATAPLTPEPQVTPEPQSSPQSTSDPQSTSELQLICETRLSADVQPSPDPPSLSNPQLTPGPTEKSDNNANLNLFSSIDKIPEQELIDNHRFLSKQGLLSEKESVPEKEEPQAVSSESRIDMISFFWSKLAKYTTTTMNCVSTFFVSHPPESGDVLRESVVESKSPSTGSSSAPA